MKGDSGEYLFAHYFLKIVLHLLARAGNVVDLSVNYIECNGGLLVLYIKKSKGGQHGENQY